MDLSKLDLVKLEKKMLKDHPEFMESLNGLSKDQIINLMATYSKNLQDVNLAKEVDQQLCEAREQVKELAGPYNDALKVLKAKLRWMNIQLQS